MTGGRKCSVCGKHEAEARFAPFCSERCKLVDLGRWLGGAYAIPVVENDDPDAEENEKQ